MNREQVREQLAREDAFRPLKQAFAEGKTIQELNTQDQWVDNPDPSFNRAFHHYRVKPEPTYRLPATFDEAVAFVGKLVRYNKENVFSGIHYIEFHPHANEYSLGHSGGWINSTNYRLVEVYENGKWVPFGIRVYP